MPIRFDHPRMLWLVLLVLPVAWMGVRSLGALDPVKQWTVILLRVLMLGVLAVMLAGVESVRWHDDLTVVAVLDQSESVRRFAPRAGGPEVGTYEEWVKQWVAQAGADRRADDLLGVVTFDGRPTARAMPAAGLEWDTGVIDEPVDGSDAAGGIRLALAMFPPDTARRLLLVSDGNDTGGRGGADRGQLLAAAREAAAAGVPIDVLPIDYHLGNEVMVDGLYAPPEAREGQTAAIRVVLRGTRAAPGVLYFYRDGAPVHLNGAGGGAGDGMAIEPGDWSADMANVGGGSAGSGGGGAARFVCVKLIELPLMDAGVWRFRAVFVPAGGYDTVAANNQADGFTLVRGKGRVLVLDNVEKGQGRELPGMLAAHGIETEVEPAFALPDDLATLSRYDAVVMQNISADAMTQHQQEVLTRYVRDLGGGLVMIGGPDSFGAGGWTGSTVEKILPVECQIPSQVILPTGAMVIVLDRSGSMIEHVHNSPYSKEEIASESAVQAINTLFQQDLVGVIAFDVSPRWVCPLKAVGGRQFEIDDLVRQIRPGGGTDIYPALEAAYEALAGVEVQENAVKHIILLTDGQSQNGPYEEITRKMALRGITLSTVGIGDDVDGPLLASLARQAGGKYYPVTDPANLPQIFIKEARTIRKTLVKEGLFRPRVVGTGSPLLAGITEVPPLLGLVRTSARADARVFTPLVGSEGEPVLAHWQVGLGRVAAFTSDATSRWAGPWLGWEGYGDFWARTVRWIARPGSGREMDLLTTVAGQSLKIRLDATGSEDGAGGGFTQLGQLQGAVIRPDGTLAHVALRQTGPGLYEGEADAPETGAYVVTVLGQDGAGRRRYVVGGASRAQGMELRQFDSDRATMEEVAAITAGRVLSAATGKGGVLFARDAGVAATRSMRPVWWPLVAALLVLFWLDVAARRVAWDVGAGWAWFKRSMTTPAGAPAAQARTLAALRRRADATDRELGTAAAKPVERATAAMVRQFEAVENSQAEREAHVSSDPAPAPGSAPAPGNVLEISGAAGGGEGKTTSRLLDAKRRARQQSEG